MTTSPTSLTSSSSIPHAVLDVLGAQSTARGLGTTTALLLFTTCFYYYLTKSSRSTSTSTSTRSTDNAKGNNASRKNGDGGDIDEEFDATKYPGGRLTVYYGSQTGTAQMFARQIADESERHGFLCTGVIDLQDVVDNDDDELLVEGDDGNNVEEGGMGYDHDARLLRATFANPKFRDDHGRSRGVFLVATYGEGEPTDNAQQFAEIMKVKSGTTNIYDIGMSSSPSPSDALDDDEKKEEGGGVDGTTTTTTTTSASSLPPSQSSFLSDLDYAVFGLGNKQYEHYNNMGKFVDMSLSTCGARRVAALGLGDDDDDLEGDFENWKDGVLWPSLISRYVGDGKIADDVAPATTTGGGGACALPPCPYAVEYVDSYSRDANSYASHSPESIQTSSRHYVHAMDCPVIARRELRDPSDPGSTVHVEIDVSHDSDVMGYRTADNLGILPKNDASIVEAVARALGYDLDVAFRLLPRADSVTTGSESNSASSSSRHTLPFPTPCTIRHCLERYCDLTGSPRRSDLKQLASYATNDLDRRALLRMSSKEGKIEYREKIVDAHVGIADIVTRLCPSISCPLEHFVMTCPRLQPRYYTISSSSTVHPTTIHITLAVLESEGTDANGNVRVHRGLCSGYLSGLGVGDAVRAFVRESTFRLPRQIERPIIMFGPGTGIAPMRAILQERSHTRRDMDDQQRGRIGASILYFGCKNRNMDYIYRNELEAFVEDGTLSELHLAFSREGPEKVYVQHLLARRAEETWKLLRDGGASIFVCGAVRMGADVSSTLQDIISRQGDMSKDKAKAYLDGMAGEGRYVQELWSD